jgi:ABC-type Co2+ transport system permease subunit
MFSSHRNHPNIPRLRHHNRDAALVRRVEVAFSFVIMMLNFPAPGGTTGNAVGAAILALTLGPWFAFLGVTGALLIQCLLFGDGAIPTFAANSFKMGLVMFFVSYYAYRLLATRAPLLSRRRRLAAAASAYIGLNAAALRCAIELGLQPIPYHTSGGSVCAHHIPELQVGSCGPETSKYIPTSSCPIIFQKEVQAWLC